MAEGAISLVLQKIVLEGETPYPYIHITNPSANIRQHWPHWRILDGRVNNFEDQILHPLFDENEMGLSNELMLFNRLKGDIGERKITQIFGQEA